MKNIALRTLIVLHCSLFAVFCSLSAQNYPNRSDFLWVTVPNHADWIYQTGEDAVVEVQLYHYGMPMDGLSVSYEIATDMLAPDVNGELTLVGGRATLNIGTMTRPGFRDLRLTTTVDGHQTQHHIKVGFSPEQIQPATQMPDDFSQFWATNLEEAAQFPLTYTVSPAPEYCTELIDCQLVCLQLNKAGQCMYGYLFKPKGAEPGTCPVVFCPPGAGVKAIKDPLRHKYYAEQGFIRLEMEIHGLDPRLTDSQFAEISRSLSQGVNSYLNNGLDDRDNYYMKRVYLGMVRCIDLLCSLPEWDGKNVAVQGGSQGGALALVTAGLDSRVTACVVNHPALTDMAGYVDGGTGGYPHFQRTPSMYTDQKRAVMAYYDVINFARLVSAPTRMTWGFNDNTCPPTTSYAAYNVLTCPKEALLTPINEHWTSENTEYDHMEWIKEHLK